MSEGTQEAAVHAVPPEDLQAAGDGDDGPGVGLPTHARLQADDQGQRLWLAFLTSGSHKWN